MVYYEYAIFPQAGAGLFPAPKNRRLPWEVLTSCLLCGSGHEAEFAAEMMIHSHGLKDFDKPDVLVSPKLLVCLNCGFSHLVIAESDLALLAIHTKAKGASTR